jgi:nicotinamide-nucleotide amidase
MMQDDLVDQAGKSLAAIQSANLTIATAESCTGGLVSAALTHHAGSSSAVLCGAVTYSNASKHRMLHVPDKSFEDGDGAVSAQVAEAMATGMLNMSGADLAVAITGIAGPGGGSEDRPVGTVWFGLARRGLDTITECQQFDGDRAAIRAAASIHALVMVEQAASAA